MCPALVRLTVKGGWPPSRDRKDKPWVMTRVHAGRGLSAVIPINVGSLRSGGGQLGFPKISRKGRPVRATVLDLQGAQSSEGGAVMEVCTGTVVRAEAATQIPERGTQAEGVR